MKLVVQNSAPSAPPLLAMPASFALFQSTLHAGVVWGAPPVNVAAMGDPQDQVPILGWHKHSTTLVAQKSAPRGRAGLHWSVARSG